MIYIHNKSSADMAEISDGAAHMVITSPPYNCDTDYGSYNDTQDKESFLAMLETVWRECSRILVPGGRLCVNVAHGIGRRPYWPLFSHVSVQIERLFEMRGTIVWQKALGTNRTSWGSWRSPADPTLRDVCEMIVVANKPGKIDIPEEAWEPGSKQRVSTWLSKDEFLKATTDHWIIPSVHSNRSGKHPAPFPPLLVERLLRLYGFPGMLIVDPFAGSGTTGYVAAYMGADAHLYEIDDNYCSMIAERLVQQQDVG